MKRGVLVLIAITLFLLPAEAKRRILLRADVPIERQLTEENVQYLIKEPLALLGKTVVIPKNSELVFKCKGVISNGTIKGQDTEIVNPHFRNVCFSGTFTNKSIVLSESTFGSNPDFWGILSSFPLLTVSLQSDITPSEPPAQDFKIAAFRIKGNGHTIRVKDFPILRGPEVVLDNIVFDCSEASQQVFYAIGSNKSFIARNCRFVNIPEVSYILCPRGFDGVTIENCDFNGTMTADSKRSMESAVCILLYGCAGDITVRNNTIRNCFGHGIDGIGFTEEKNTKILVENNKIDRVTNGGIVFTGGDVWNVTVKNNSISNTHYLGKQFPEESNGGPNSAINFHGFRNVIVEGNTITDCMNSSGMDFDGSVSSGTKVAKGHNLIVRGNKCTRTGAIALFVVKDVVFENNTITNDNTYAYQSVIAISGASNVKIQKNLLHLNKGQVKAFYPIYLTDTKTVRSGRIQIEGNIVSSDSEHFVFINSHFEGYFQLGTNEVKSSGRPNGKLFIVNNSRQKVAIPAKSKMELYH